MIWGVAHAQTTYSIRADSTKLEKVGGNNELILLNGSRNIPGFLFNKGNGRTIFRSIPTSFNIPLFITNDTVVNINYADSNNDGVITTADWLRFDSATRYWKDTLSAIKAIIPKDTQSIYFKNFYFGAGYYGNYYNGTTVFPAFHLSITGQSVFIGGRGAAAAKKAGTLTGIENTAVGEWSLNSLTSGSAMTAIGKTAGGNKTNETYGIYIGQHAFGVAGRSNELQIGSSNWIYGWNGRIALGHNNPQERLHVGGKVKIDTIPNSTSTDSVLTTDNNVVTKMAISDLPTNPSSLPSIISVSSSTTLSAPSGSYNIIEVDASGGSVTLTLPNMTSGKGFYIKKIDSSVNAVIFTTDEGIQSITTQWAGAQIYRRSSSYGINGVY